MNNQTTDKNPIILFDGICNFCNSSVNFIIENDKNDVFRFASLQSDFTKELRNTINIPDEIDSIILILNGKCFTKSDAVLEISRNLNGFWKLFYAFIVIPKFIRNFFYDIIAKNRYKWFGKKEVCMIPSEEIKSKFL